MKNLISVLLIFSFISCSKKKVEIPVNIIPMQKMQHILTDVQLAQSAAGNGALIDSSIFNTKEYFEYILTKNQIKREDFLTSLKFYTDNPELLQEVYDSVIVDLSRMQSKNEAR